MAKKHKLSQGVSAAKEGTPVQVSLQATDSTVVLYVNHAEVGHTMHDFTMACTKLPVKLSPAQMATAKERGQLPIDALVHLILPPTMLPGLIRALSLQKELYEKQFGTINDPNEVARKSRSEH